MREILFRGKRIDNGEWIEGSLWNNYGEVKILSALNAIGYEVIPETAGQYTGLTDINGKKIFEGDIINSENELETDSGIGQVIWLNEFGLWYVNEVNNGIGDLTRSGFVKIIGNIHDNPELLKGDKDNG